MAAPSSSPAPSPATSPPRRRILFVDDDVRFLEMIERVMGVWSKDSWEIFTAQNTGKALSIIQDVPVNLVVIDVQMPVVDGLQFLTLLNRKYPNLQKVAMTGYANENYRAACLSNGAELFLEKQATLEGMESVFNTLNEIIKWQPEERFHGVLRRVWLQDVLQMECLSRNSSILEVSAGNEQGEIFIRDGAIVHASTGQQRGENAFNHLLALAGGEFKLKPFQQPAEQTINGSWESLLMEAARRRDESGAEPEAAGMVPPPSTPAGPPAGSPAPEPPVEHLHPAAPTTAAESLPPALVTLAPVGAHSVLPEVDAFPTRIDEVLLCSGQGDVLYEWQCRNSDVWINFLEFISQKSRHVSQGLALGNLDRLEIRGTNSRVVARVGSDWGVVIRSSKAPLDLKTSTTA
jgi:CheY-like chemotaxis protein